MALTYNEMGGTEVDRTKAKYNELLTKTEVLNHPAWNAAIEEDKKLLEAYSKIVFDALKLEKAMGFWLRDTPSQDELRALCVGDLYGNSIAFGYDDLSYDARLRLAHTTKS